MAEAFNNILLVNDDQVKEYANTIVLFVQQSYHLPCQFSPEEVSFFVTEMLFGLLECWSDMSSVKMGWEDMLCLDLGHCVTISLHCGDPRTAMHFGINADGFFLEMNVDPESLNKTEDDFWHMFDTLSGICVIETPEPAKETNLFSLSWPFDKYSLHEVILSGSSAFSILVELSKHLPLR